MILQILARCGAFFIGFIVKGQMNHDFAFGIEVNPCVIEITIGKAMFKYVLFYYKQQDKNREKLENYVQYLEKIKKCMGER